MSRKKVFNNECFTYTIRVILLKLTDTSIPHYIRDYMLMCRQLDFSQNYVTLSTMNTSYLHTQS